MREVDIDLYCEDIDQESLIRGLVQRIARESGVISVVHERSVRGGKGNVKASVQAFQSAVKKGQPGFNCPDLLVIAVDGNCQGVNATISETSDWIDSSVFGRVAVACPDPHIEKWYLADPAAFARIVGIDGILPEQKCAKDVYKRHLEDLIKRALDPVLLGAHEFAPEIADEMNFFVAGKADTGLRLFERDLRSHCRNLASI